MELLLEILFNALLNMLHFQPDAHYLICSAAPLMDNIWYFHLPHKLHFRFWWKYLAINKYVACPSPYFAWEQAVSRLIELGYCWIFMVSSTIIKITTNIDYNRLMTKTCDKILLIPFLLTRAIGIILPKYWHLQVCYQLNKHSILTLVMALQMPSPLSVLLSIYLHIHILFDTSAYIVRGEGKMVSKFVTEDTY